MIEGVRRVALAGVGLLTVASLMLLHPPTRSTIVSTLLNTSHTGVRLLPPIHYSLTDSQDDGDGDYFDYDLTNRTVEEIIKEYEQEGKEDYNEGGADDPHWQAMMKDRFAQRLATMRAACRKYDGQLSYSVYRTLSKHLYYNKKYRLMVCVVAKAGSTTWKTHLLTLRGQNSFSGNVHNVPRLRAKRQMTLRQVRAAMTLQTTTTVMNARHPLDRLASAYRDKFRDGHLLGVTNFFVRDAMKSLKKNTNGEHLVSISFPEFLTHVLREQISTLENLHWRNYYRTCSPCALHYDYIMKTETYSEDLSYIVNKIGATEINVEQRRHAISSTSSTHYFSYYQNVSAATLRNLYKFYKVDFEMFGYDVPDFMLKAL